MTIDYDARRTFLGGEEVKLTQTEYNTLRSFRSIVASL